MIDLPSMGANQQIRNVDTGESAAVLELPDLSKMLGQWLDIVGIDKVSVMGMSLGSVVASSFASTSRTGGPYGADGRDAKDP